MFAIEAYPIAARGAGMVELFAAARRTKPLGLSALSLGPRVPFRQML